MALVKNSNSYATTAEAASYFENRLDVAAWTEAAEAQRAQALVTATQALDEMAWTGIAASDSQLLAFPRIGSYFDPRLGFSVDLSGVPARILTATYELAYHLLNNDGLLDETGSVNNLQIGSISLQAVKAPSMVPPLVKRIIKPLLVNQGSNAWYRSN